MYILAPKLRYPPFIVVQLSFGGKQRRSYLTICDRLLALEHIHIILKQIRLDCTYAFSLECGTDRLFLPTVLYRKGGMIRMYSLAL
jgi:hypothetical protein